MSTMNRLLALSLTLGLLCSLIGSAAPLKNVDEVVREKYPEESFLEPTSAPIASKKSQQLMAHSEKDIAHAQQLMRHTHADNEYLSEAGLHIQESTLAGAHAIGDHLKGDTHDSQEALYLAGTELNEADAEIRASASGGVLPASHQTKIAYDAMERAVHDAQEAIGGTAVTAATPTATASTSLFEE